MFDPADRSRKRAAAVGEGHPKFRKTFENSAEDHRTDRERTFSRHANQPGQPIFRHPLLAHHVPWMNKDRGAQFPRRFPENIERRMIEISAIRAVAVIVRIDMRSDLDAVQSEFAYTTGQFLGSKVDILERNCAEPCKSFWIRAHNIRDVVI
jgi:hypothetical protein